MTPGRFYGFAGSCSPVQLTVVLWLMDKILLFLIMGNAGFCPSTVWVATGSPHQHASRNCRGVETFRKVSTT